MEEQKLIPIKGNTVDDETRCIHYHSPLDIIAIKFKCCDTYYPCVYCHEESADHAPQRWKQEEWDNHAILCGRCKTELTIWQYFGSNYTCPNCISSFNPGCSAHNKFYFEVPE